MTTASAVRRQLSLFVADRDAVAIERLREQLDPLQFALIPAHVTLCREEDLVDVTEAQLDERLVGAAAIILGFGPAQAFSTHGILLPCIEGEAHFQALRSRISGGGSKRHQSPHITLAHPRNPKATGNSLQAAAALGRETHCRFDRLNLVEQNAGNPWRVLRSWRLAP